MKKQNLLSLGLTRGILFMIMGELLGMGLVSGIRVLMGLTAWNAEPAWVVGGLVGTIAFLYGVGSINDWLKWMRGESTPEHHELQTDGPGWARYFGFSLDHKVIGIQYGVTSLIMFSIAGLFALIFRTELVQTGMQFLTPDFYNTFMSLHGIVMIMSILLGVAAMSNYLVPLMIGASDMAFPRLNGFAFWINVPSGILLLSSLFLGGFDTGWTGYPPLSVRAPLGMQMFFLGVYLFGFSSILGSLNIITTILRMRVKGMGLFRMPIFVWTALATSVISLTATQLIALSFQLVMFQRLLGMGFFDPLKGGHPILFQHLFWFYSHPAVYVFVLTGLGMISELLPVFARKPLFGYRWVALSSFGIALVGFFVWAHHMFTSGMDEFLRVPFMYSTLLVAVPTGIKFFSWVATLWQGKISFETPMLFILGAIVIFLVGGMTGPPHGTVATDLYLHDTYFVVGHFHATMFGGFVFPFMAAIYYWFPKMTGRMYNERLGKIHFFLMFPAFFVQSFGQMFVGLLGMRRRIADYDPALGLETPHLLITIAGFVIGIAVLIFIANLVVSARRGAVAAMNPWRSRSPEWGLPSPIPAHNYAGQTFEVVGDPYDYGLADAPYVKWDNVPAPASD
jgi:cytochrome c oxidase subunit 1